MIVALHITMGREHVRPWQDTFILLDLLWVHTRGLGQCPFVVEDGIQRFRDQRVGIHEEDLGVLDQLEESEFGQYVALAICSCDHPVGVEFLDEDDCRTILFQAVTFALRDVAGAEYEEGDAEVRAGGAGVQELVGEDASAEEVAVLVIRNVFFSFGMGVGSEERGIGHLWG